MISVLIPIFNYNVTELVISLRKQLKSENIPFEIICMNDASSKFIFENEVLSKMEQVEYVSLLKNVGRSKIRNLLAERANFRWLLFLDADVIPENDFFIKKYLEAIKSDMARLYFGGVINKKNRPANDEVLRWVYGRKREDISFEVRSTNPYNYFLSANFLIDKSVFDRCRFDEEINRYGYEDYVFAEKLKEKKMTIEHIDNSVFHNGIEKSQVFLFKTKEAIENLYCLKSQGIINGEKMKLLKYVKTIEALNFVWLFNDIFYLFEKFFERNLKSKKPSLFIFDLFKLTYYCSLMKMDQPNLSY